MDAVSADREPSRCHVHIVSLSPLFAQALACLAQAAGLAAQANPTQAQSGSPDVVLFDSDLSDDAAVERSSELRARYPQAPLLLLVREANPQVELYAAQVGAAGVLTRGVSRTELVDGLRAVAAGRPLPLSTRTRDFRPATHLTLRELAVLRLLAAGRRNADIADELGISANTVRTHVQNILNKLGASSRGAAVAMARQGGLLTASRSASSLCAL
jgi:DNA-binding NarL/FixJ family response regulator